MSKTLWVFRDKHKQDKSSIGYISDKKPTIKKMIQYDRFYQFQTDAYGKISTEILNILGVKEGECKQFRFEELIS